MKTKNQKQEMNALSNDTLVKGVTKTIHGLSQSTERNFFDIFFWFVINKINYLYHLNQLSLSKRQVLSFVPKFWY